MDDDVKDFIGIGMICLLGFLLLIGTIGLIAWPLQSYGCHSQWDRSGMKVEFGPIEGCMVLAQQGWIPADNYHNGNIVVSH